MPYNVTPDLQLRTTNKGDGEKFDQNVLNENFIKLDERSAAMRAFQTDADTRLKKLEVPPVPATLLNKEDFTLVNGSAGSDAVTHFGKFTNNTGAKLRVMYKITGVIITGGNAACRVELQIDQGDNDQVAKTAIVGSQLRFHSESSSARTSITTFGYAVIPPGEVDYGVRFVVEPSSAGMSIGHIQHVVQAL